MTRKVSDLGHERNGITDAVMRLDAAWHFFVVEWDNVQTPAATGWSWIALPLLTGIVSFIVQAFFAWRIYKLSGTIWISVPIIFVAFMQVRRVSAITPSMQLATLNVTFYNLGHLCVH